MTTQRLREKDRALLVADGLRRIQEFEAASIIEALLAELEAAKKDAERYRYCKAIRMFKSDDPDSWIDAALNPAREDVK